jgi:prefoldin subunit 5
MPIDRFAIVRAHGQRAVGSCHFKIVAHTKGQVMIRFSLLIPALLAILPLVHADPAAPDAEAPVKVAASRVTHVTVYQSNALVTREVDVPAGIGPMELVVNPLPPQTQDSSLYSEGTDGIRVLTTRYRMRPIKEDTREEVRKLEAQLKELKENAQKLESQIKTIEQNLAMLMKLEGFTGATMQHATEKGQLNAEGTITLAKYVMESRAKDAQTLTSLQQQRQANQEQMQFAQRQLAELSAGPSKTERDAVIVVHKTNEAAGKVKLHYLANAASWRPQYKFRANKEKDPVQLEYLAALTQQTGEDWANVAMTLSTAQPSLNAAPPDLRMLQVAVAPTAGGKPAAGQQPAQPDIQGQARGYRQQAQQELNRNNFDTGNKLANDAAALEQTWHLLVAREDHRGGPRNLGGGDLASDVEGPSVTYHLPAKLSIPSRQDEQVVEVAKVEMTPDYFYKAVPVLTKHVYRLANLTNKSVHVLLPGEATMYVGTDFVGRTTLPLVAAGEQFTIGLGVDPQLQVQRQMVDKTRATQGANQVLKYDYRILVNSYKSEPVKMQVWDRLPHAENEVAGVNLIKTTPELSKDSLYLREERPKNLLRWDVVIDPTMSGEKAMAIVYDFKLELDKQMQISGFISK